MTATKIYTREDVRDVWRKYQHGDTAAGNDLKKSHSEISEYKKRILERATGAEPACNL